MIASNSSDLISLNYMLFISYKLHNQLTSSYMRNVLSMFMYQIN